MIGVDLGLLRRLILVDNLVAPRSRIVWLVVLHQKVNILVQLHFTSCCTVFGLELNIQFTCCLWWHHQVRLSLGRSGCSIADDRFDLFGLLTSDEPLLLRVNRRVKVFYWLDLAIPTRITSRSNGFRRLLFPAFPRLPARSNDFRFLQVSFLSFNFFNLLSGCRSRTRPLLFPCYRDGLRLLGREDMLRVFYTSGESERLRLELYLLLVVMLDHMVVNLIQISVVNVRTLFLATQTSRS